MTITPTQKVHDQDIREELLRTFEIVYPIYVAKSTVGVPTKALKEHRKRLKIKERFDQLMECEAYTDAALMLIPNGWKYLIDSATPDGLVTVSLWNHGICVVGESGGNIPCIGEHPAIAITMAALAAQEFLSGY